MSGGPAKPRGGGRAVFLTQQSIGLGDRKTSIIFLAEAFARQGREVAVVTVQLSWLTALGRNGRMARYPAERRNRWFAVDGMRGYVWVPPVHPARFGPGWINRLTGPAVPLYGRLLPADLRRAIAEADVIVVESCSAVALFGEIVRINPDAIRIYSMSDRLGIVGMHPALDDILRRDADDYDLIRVPAAAMCADFAGDNTAHIPHGLDKALFDVPSPSPYAGGTNAVLAGDMMLDQETLGRLARAFPDIAFHIFGRAAIELRHRRANLVVHGEVPFATLVPFIRHADIGLALYTYRPGLDYLAQSSLKNLQYAYCGLPVVAPHFVSGGLPRAHGYDPGDPAGAVAAFAAARAATGMAACEADRAAIRDWDGVAAEMILRATERAGRRQSPEPAHSALPPDVFAKAR